MLQSFTFALLAAPVAGHGWLVKPLSKIELVQQMRSYQDWQEGMPSEFRYCPSCSANGNNGAAHLDTPAANCGATSEVTAQGLSVWQKWYDAGGFSVPVMTPGSDFEVKVELPADHGGQFWLMLSCDTSVTQGTNWTILDRSVDHRDYSALPSNPAIYAWPPQSSGGEATTYYHVPSSFSCPGGEGIGRWLWKTGNTCNDANNIGRPTETFQLSELPWNRGVCAPGQKPETFIACFDFKMDGSSPPAPPTTPTPTPQVPSPTPAPEPTVPPSPHACLGFCGRDSQTSCSALSLSEDACEEGYMRDGSIVIPCLWTDCGCIADGDHLLECPDLSTICVNPPTPAPTPIGGIDDCESFCTKENLNTRFQNWTLGPQNEESFCYYYKHHGDLCEASYLQADGYLDGLSVPCIWTGDSCVAHQAGAKDCSGFSCGAGLVASNKSLQHDASLVDHALGLRGSNGAAPQSMEPLSVSGPTLLEIRHEHSRTDPHLEDDVDTNRQKSSEEL